MSHATMLEHVKAELDYVDAEALQSIQEIIDRSKRKSVIVLTPAISTTQNRPDLAAGISQPLQFVGENLKLEEYEKLSVDERRMLARHIKEQNHIWLQKTFSALDAAWLVVVDSQVIASGKSLQEQPMQPEIREIYQRIYCVFDWRLSPFVHINPNRIALIGRDVLLELKPRVLLDFEKRQTEIGTSVKPKPTRKKSAIRKKRTPRRR